MSDLTTNPPSEREGLDFTRKPSAFVSPSSLAEAIRRGWQITPARKKLYFEAMDAALKDLPKDPRDKAHIVVGVNRVLQAEQAAALRDVHHLEDIAHEDGVMDLRMRRAEEGLPNDSLALQVAPVEQLPLPPALASYTKRILRPSES